MVLFPAPAGPSMAMISLRACGGWVGCWFIVAARLYTGRVDKNRTLLANYRAALDGAGTGTTFGGVICSIDLPAMCTKLNSRAASKAFTASFTFDRAMNFPKNASSSDCSTATTQSRYFDTSAESASGTDNPTPSLTASGAQRWSRSQTEPSLAL